MQRPVNLVSHGVSRCVEIEWDDGVVSRLPHSFLRLHCRCAECLQSKRSGRPVEPHADVELLAVVPYGPASVQLRFSDGHARGIFPFPYLRELATRAGLSTEPNLT